MIFGLGRSKKVSDPSQPRISEPSTPSLPGDATERSALVGVLRSFGRFAFDTDARTAQRHAEDFTQRARSVERSGDGEPVDAGALTRAFTDARREEVDYVSRTLGELRATVSGFVQSLGRLVASDGQSDASMRARIAQLRVVADSGSPEQLRREALSVADDLVKALNARGERQQAELAKLGARIASLGGELEEARNKGARDPLTQLLNRGALDEWLARTAELNAVLPQPACLLMVDVDHFKSINDDHGHPAGDAVLRGLADCLTRTFLRKSDLVARYGGEEMVVLVHEAHPKDAPILAERLLTSVRGLSVRHGEKTLRITASAGVATLRAKETPAQWLARADKALYEAKRAGRDRAVIADD